MVFIPESRCLPEHPAAHTHTHTHWEHAHRTHAHRTHTHIKMHTESHTRATLRDLPLIVKQTTNSQHNAHGGGVRKLFFYIIFCVYCSGAIFRIEHYRRRRCTCVNNNPVNLGYKGSVVVLPSIKNKFKTNFTQKCLPPLPVKLLPAPR